MTALIPDVSPEQYRTVYEFPPFSREWRRLGLTDREMVYLNATIMASPDRPPVIPGTGGLRKIRFAPPGSGRGKRGGYRVVYADLPDFGILILAMIFSKKADSDLSDNERAILAAAVADYESALRERRAGRGRPGRLQP